MNTVLTVVCVILAIIILSAYEVSRKEKGMKLQKIVFITLIAVSVLPLFINNIGIKVIYMLILLAINAFLFKKAFLRKDH